MKRTYRRIIGITSACLISGFAVLAMPSIATAVKEPASVEINPDYLPYMIDLDDGTIWLDLEGNPISRERLIELEIARIERSFDNSNAPAISNSLGKPGPEDSIQQLVTCTSTNYKVKYHQTAQQSESTLCFNNVGVSTVPNSYIYMMQSVDAVCPGQFTSQSIHYQASGKWNWSTVRGYASNNSVCYRFDASGVYPTQFDQADVY
ncbi:MAG: hypothetical protein LBB58_06360 [Cellulomonadaceae bacterium]|nr:hypothetical protein [Cellulomonadaceae bacterium]